MNLVNSRRADKVAIAALVPRPANWVSRLEDARTERLLMDVAKAQP